MPVTRAMVKGSGRQLSVDKDGECGRKRKDSRVVPLLDPNDNPLMNDVVLGTLFEYVRVKDLKSCRLVSKKWNRASLQFVRSNFTVNISGTNITYNSPEIKGVQHFVQLISANTLGIPFSRYRLGTFDTTKGPGQQFLQLCGKTATDISFNHNDAHTIENIAELLRSTPKLETLILPHTMTAKNRKRKVVKLFPEDIKPKLQFLKSVNVEPKDRDNPTEILKKCPTFYEELFEVAENISTLDLMPFSPELGLKILETVAKFGRMELIKNLKFRQEALTTPRPEHLELLKGLKLENLDLEFFTFEPVIVDWFQVVPLSRNTLTSLHMKCFSPDPTTMMNFQPMPKLKELELGILAENNLSPNHNNFSHIFPSLEKLNFGVIALHGNCNEFISFTGDDDSPCPNMESLIFRVNLMEMDTLNRVLTIFPTLKVFKCKIGETDGEEVISGIWTHMTQLENLSIRGILKSTENLDSLVTGIPVEEIKRRDMKKFLGSLQQQSTDIRGEQISMQTNKHCQLPSIRNLTNLRSLELNLKTIMSGGQKTNHLTDVTAYLGIYSLKNLRHLSARRLEISRDCADTLVKDMGLHTWSLNSSYKIRGGYRSFKFESN